MALALKEALHAEALVLTPDLELHPQKALQQAHEIIARENPDLLVGNSCGAFLAQMLAQSTETPALLGNPHFEMTRFLQQRIGVQQYKAPRKDGHQTFVIDKTLIEEFAQLEKTQWEDYSPRQKNSVWGLFGTQDTLAHYEPMFLKYYTHSFHFPGAHTPTPQEVRLWYVPLILEMLKHFTRKEIRLAQQEL